ncbi:unnamed protein product [Penicillium camemberti]|uniref:Str. FM013 n=1 Tax=Penicillium camemberti (strain FM 013) TaxID=1429867 RepID=A0A0G4NW81_PENC3|nr:unnamed protein product [Penicillium camemberti]
MPALRSASQDWAHQMPTNASITHTKRRSTRPISSISNKSATRYMSQRRQLSKCNSTSKLSPPAANIAPAEILLEIFSMLTPRDFDNARRTCSQWMRTSLNHRLLENMLKRAGWWDAWLQDRQTPRISRLDESEVWRMSRRFATECLLSGRKLNVEKSGFLTTAMVDFSSLTDSTRRTSRRTRLQPVLQMTENKGSGMSTFSISSCSNYLLVTTGCMIYIYCLSGRKSRPTSATNFSDDNLALVSRISCPFNVLSAAIDTSKPQFTIAALLCNRVGMICNLDMAWAKDSATNSKMATSSRHFFYNICTVDNPPRTVALCPGRPIVAFGCAAGIEIHSVNETKRNEQRKHFTLPQPSEILHFLPSSSETPSELRLISSLSGPGLHECKCPPSPSPSSSPSSTSSPKLDPKNNQFHFLADIQSFNRRRIPHAPSRSFVRATHCHHYRAVPINDGFHIMFIEPRTNLLCIGTDAPIGGTTNLTRAFVCVPPPFSNTQDGQTKTPPPSPSPSNTTPPPADLPIPTTFAAGSDLRWGLRIVAAYGDRLVLYSIPLDVFNVIRKERERQGDGIMGSSDLALDWYVDAERSRKRRESLVQNQNGDWEFLLSVSYRPTAMMWPFKIYGKEIGSVKGTVELALQSSQGGVRVWAFGEDGKGTVLDVDTGDAPTRSLGVGSDGGLEDLGIVQRAGLGGLGVSRKRKFEEVKTGFAGRYGAGRYSAGVDVKPCAAGVHGIHQDPSVRRSSFAACIIDFKIPLY